MEKKIGLIACSKKKQGKEEPDKLFEAHEIYQGNSFLKSRDEGLKKYGCEDWHILSAKHGLLDKNEKIKYYDEYLGNKSSNEKKEWAENVLQKLKEKYDLSKTEFYIFGGKSYYEGLIGKLHCFTFKYKSSNCIDLDGEPTEHTMTEKK